MAYQKTEGTGGIYFTADRYFGETVITVLSVLWLGAPAWYCLLTQAEKTDIDRVAKVGLKMIFWEKHCGFKNTVKVSGISNPLKGLQKLPSVLQ